MYKNNTDCTVYVKGYNNDGTQIPGTFAIPAGETIEVDGYSFVVPNKRVFGIWGGVYLDTVSRGNTEYETDGNNNAWVIICKSNHPVKITPIKLTQQHLSHKDFSEALADVWTLVEFPNVDVNVSTREFIEYFQRAHKEWLMDEDEYEFYKNLPEEITV